MNTINIAQDFYPYPAGRHEEDGPYTGEKFRKAYLVPALQKNSEVQVVLDGTLGPGSSFLEEAFGGLIREENFTEDQLNSKLKIISKRASLETLIHNHIHNAAKVLAKHAKE